MKIITYWMIGLLACAAFTGCGRALSQKTSKIEKQKVFVDLAKLISLHPHYRASNQLLSAQKQMRAFEEGTFLQLQAAKPQFTQELSAAPSPLSWQKTLERKATSAMEQIQQRHQKALLAVENALATKRRAAQRSLSEQTSTLAIAKRREIREFERQIALSQIDEIVGLLAQSQAPDLPEERREETQRRLQELRALRKSLLEAESRHTAFALQRIWAETMLEIESDLSGDRKELGKLLMRQASEAQERVEEDVISFTKVVADVADFPGGLGSAELETRTISLSRSKERLLPQWEKISTAAGLRAAVRAEVIQAVRKIAQDHFWEISFKAGEPGRRDVTEEIKKILKHELD